MLSANSGDGRSWDASISDAVKPHRSGHGRSNALGELANLVLDVGEESVAGPTAHFHYDHLVISI